MKNEMTEVDIRKIEEELAYRRDVLAPELHAEVKRTREYGDLSENAEYKQAKYERNRNVMVGHSRFESNFLTLCLMR